MMFSFFIAHVQFADETVKICPARETIIHEYDQIVVIAEDDDTIVLSTTTPDYPSIAILFETNADEIVQASSSTNIEKYIILG